MKDEKQLASGKSQTPDLAPAIYARPEDLPAGLQDLTRGPDDIGLTWFSHPFFVSFFPLATSCPIEDLLAFRQNRSEQLLAAKEFSSYIFLHERAYRMDILLDLMRDGAFDARPEDYWKLLAQVWVDAEHDEDSLIWTEVLNAPLTGRDKMTKGKDWERLEAMPSVLTVYRGVQGQDEYEALDNGLSGFQWTLSPKTARFFAKRFLRAPNQGFVLQTQVPKDRVIAYLTGRGEEEIIISPDDIDETQVEISDL